MNPANQNIYPNTIHRNLHTLVLLRWLLLALGSLCLIMTYSHLQLHLAYAALGSILAGFCALNCLTLWRLSWGPKVRSTELLAQLCVDIAGLGLLLYFTGGATNPFVSYLLVPICIAAMTLPLPLTLLTAALATLCYWWLLSQYIPVEHLAPAYQGDAGNHTMNHGAGALHIYGMWLNFILSAAIITAFVSRIASQLRAQQQLTQAQRERVLHAEQLTTIATLTAGTAHELGTPLATIKIAADELQLAALPADLANEASVISQQIGICQSALARLREQARSGMAVQPEIASARAWLQSTVSQWSLINPGSKLVLDLSALSDAAQLRLDPTLAQSLINLLHNAAQHSRCPVRLSARTANRRLYIDVEDSGPALSESIKAQWGQPFNSSSELGMGLGVFLSNSTIERHGGELQVLEQTDGKIVRILLPLAGA